eukprot:Selendium_serpulae@DN4562_c0_g1_i1.p1
MSQATFSTSPKVSSISSAISANIQASPSTLPDSPGLATSKTLSPASTPSRKFSRPMYAFKNQIRRLSTVSHGTRPFSPNHTSQSTLSPTPSPLRLGSTGSSDEVSHRGSQLTIVELEPSPALSSRSEARSEAPSLASCDLPFCRLTPAQEWEEKDDNKGKWISPFIPSSNGDVIVGLSAVKTGPGDVVCDLGSGDGRTLIAAVRLFKTDRAMGVEVNPELVSRTKLSAITSLGSRIAQDSVVVIEANLPHAADPESERKCRCSMAEPECVLTNRNQGTEHKSFQNGMKTSPSGSLTDGSSKCGIGDKPEDCPLACFSNIQGEAKSLSIQATNSESEEDRGNGGVALKTPPRPIPAALPYCPTVRQLTCRLKAEQVSVLFTYLLPRQLESLSDCFEELLHHGVRMASLRFPLFDLSDDKKPKPKAIIEGFKDRIEDPSERKAVPFSTFATVEPPPPQRVLNDMTDRSGHRIFVYYETVAQSGGKTQ